MTATLIHISGIGVSSVAGQKINKLKTKIGWITNLVIVKKVISPISLADGFSTKLMPRAKSAVGAAAPAKILKAVSTKLNKTYQKIFTISLFL